MTNVVFHHDVPLLPEEVIAVRLYGLKEGKSLATIGNPVIDPIKRLGVKIGVTEFDFLTIALAVTAADTFIERKNAADRWTREINLKIPLCCPDIWNDQKENLKKTLNFLSGDIWDFEFCPDGYAPPEPYGKRHKLLEIKDLNCICLFSGGLDSTIGAINLLHKEEQPLFVSHSYKGDQAKQDAIACKLEKKYSKFPHFSLNADPKSVSRVTEITMRTRSFNFLAFGVVGAYAVAAKNNLDIVDLYVPENGFISINAPLTNRRIGSLSTRTTHPYFFELMESIFENVGIKVQIKNPYKFKTKGEMIKGCLDSDILQEVVSDTVSCSNWKRKKKQCGRCVPCLIRKSSIFSSNISESVSYVVEDLVFEYNNGKNRDDLFSIMAAIAKLPHENIAIWIANSGKIPFEDREKYEGVFERGLLEVEGYLKSEGVLDD